MGKRLLRFYAWQVCGEKRCYLTPLMETHSEGERERAHEILGRGPNPILQHSPLLREKETMLVCFFFMYSAMKRTSPTRGTRRPLYRRGVQGIGEDTVQALDDWLRVLLRSVGAQARRASEGSFSWRGRSSGRCYCLIASSWSSSPSCRSTRSTSRGSRPGR